MLVLIRMGKRLRLNKIKLCRQIVDWIKGYLRSHTTPFKVKIQNFRMHKINWIDYLNKAYEPDVTLIFKNEIKNGDIVMDVGADYGYFSLLASGLVGNDGKVYAFEPFPFAYQNLIENIKLNKFTNIIPIQKAVNKGNGKRKFF